MLCGGASSSRFSAPRPLGHLPPVRSKPRSRRRLGSWGRLRLRLRLAAFVQRLREIGWIEGRNRRALTKDPPGSFKKPRHTYTPRFPLTAQVAAALRRVMPTAVLACARPE